jgi:hypothetical protein
MVAVVLQRQQQLLLLAASVVVRLAAKLPLHTSSSSSRHQCGCSSLLVVGLAGSLQMET